MILAPLRVGAILWARRAPSPLAPPYRYSKHPAARYHTSDLLRAAGPLLAQSGQPAMPGDLHRPALEPGPFRRTHQHALGRFVEHHSHHLISAPRYPAGSVVLAGLILAGCQSKYRPDRLGVPEAGRHIDRDAIGQRDHSADTRDRHQAPAHITVPNMPTLRPKLRKVARRSFSMAMAFD